MKEGTSLAMHINAMGNLMSQLTGIKAQVPKDDAIAVLLKSLQDILVLQKHCDNLAESTRSYSSRCYCFASRRRAKGQEYI